MALCGQIVDFIGLNLAHQTNQTGGIGQIAIMQSDGIFLNQVIDTSSIGDGSTTNNSVNLIAFLQKELCEVRSILTGDTSDKCLFHVFYSSLKNDLSFDVLSVILSYNYILWILAAYLKC